MSKKFNIQKEESPETKEVELEVLEKEQDAFIVRVNGWRMRVYFDKDYEKHSGKIKVKYTGDIENVHSIKFEKLK